MSSETMIETSASANGVSSRPLTIPSPGYNHGSPSPPSTTTLASHLLAAVSQVQSLSSQLPPSVQLPTISPPGGVGGYRPGGLLGTTLPQLPLGSEPPMSSLLAGLKDFPRPYHSPPPLPSCESHECKIVEYRGAKVAAFIIGGETMLCLPQAFELFLKHLVGGLHTVYTKLKRLGIEPLVCNVDQVRILRGLGAIQPGVNRCKLLSVQHFDILYRDCTTASSRPGRPPKRASDFMTMTSSPEALFDLKKRHLENGIGGGAGFPNGHIGNDPRLDKSPLLANGYHAPPHFNPLQYMAHHMAGLGYPHLLPGGLPGGVPGGPVTHPHQISPPEASPMKQITPESLARMHEERVERERQMMLDARRGLPPTSMALATLHTPHLPPHNPHTSSIPHPPTSTAHDDHQPPTSPILNLSKTMSNDGGVAPEERDEEEERESELRSQGSSLREEEAASRRLSSKTTNSIPSITSAAVSTAGGTGGGGGGGGARADEDRLSDMDDEEADKDESAMDTGDIWSLNSSTPGMTQLTPPPPNIGSTPLGFGSSAPLSSTEVLLRNILGLLRVAEENARHHERQTQYEKAELKMEVLRERELRETLEKQLQEEQKNRILMQKRCAKLKKLRRRLQERLDLEVKRRSRYEDHIRSASPDVLNDINGSLRKDMEAIAAELQQENLHQQQQQQLEEERNKETVDRLLASPSLANHPAIAAATAVVNSNSWR